MVNPGSGLTASPWAVAEAIRYVMMGRGITLPRSTSRHLAREFLSASGTHDMTQLTEYLNRKGL